MAGDRSVYSAWDSPVPCFWVSVGTYNIYTNISMLEGYMKSSSCWGHRQPDIYSELCPYTCGQWRATCSGKGLGCDRVLFPSMLAGNLVPRPVGTV